MDDNTEVIRGNDGSWNPLGFGQAFSTPGGSTQQYGFTNNYAPSPQAKALGTVIEILNDPRNSWMGLGPMAGVIKGPGWGAEALRRYKLMGGTPETLNHTLKMRAMHPESRNEIVSNFRRGTDIAAPGEDYQSRLLGLPTGQERTMNIAGSIYEQMDRGGRPNTRFGSGPAQDITMHRPGEPNMESASAANAAYGAVSRQVARMLDTPGFQFSRAQDLPRVTQRDYNTQFPQFTERHPGTPAAEVRAQMRRDLGLDRTLDTGTASRRASDLVPGAGATRRQWPDNRPAYGGPERRARPSREEELAREALDPIPPDVERLFQDWQRDERDLTQAELRRLRDHFGPSFPD
jgi:hypothetical protein